MRSREMAGKIPSVRAKACERKDSQGDHEEGEPLATRRVWLIEPGTVKSKYGCNQFINTQGKTPETEKHHLN